MEVNTGVAELGASLGAGVRAQGVPGLGWEDSPGPGLQSADSGSGSSGPAAISPTKDPWGARPRGPPRPRIRSALNPGRVPAEAAPGRTSLSPGPAAEFQERPCPTAPTSSPARPPRECDLPSPAGAPKSRPPKTSWLLAWPAHFWTLRSGLASLFLTGTLAARSPLSQIPQHPRLPPKFGRRSWGDPPGSQTPNPR